MSNPLSRRLGALETKGQETDAPLRIVCVSDNAPATVRAAMMREFGTPEPSPGANVLVIVTGVERASDDPA